jgi:hypothetical protein
LKGFHAYSLLGSDDKVGEQEDAENHHSPTPTGSIGEVPESTPGPLPVVTAREVGTIDSYRSSFFSRAPLKNEPISVPESDPQPIRTRGPDSKPVGQSPEPISTRGQASKPKSIQDQLPVKHMGPSRPGGSLQELGTRIKKEEPGQHGSGWAGQLSNLSLAKSDRAQKTRDQQSSRNKGPGSQKVQEERGIPAWQSLLLSGWEGGNDGKSTGKTRLQGRVVQKGLLQTGRCSSFF